MASSEAQFLELLGSESYVDLTKLREWAFHGVPSRVRGPVYLFLLEVFSPDRSQEMKLRKSLTDEYQEILSKPTIYSEELRRLHNQIQRYIMSRDQFRENEYGCQTSMQNIIVAHINNNPTVEYEPQIIGLVAPLVLVMEEPYEAFFCFERLMSKVDACFPIDSMPKCVSQFTMLFRAVHPELFLYLEDELVEISSWATSWLRYLLSRELSDVSCLLRLWDTYFSCDEGLKLHIFVCLAILVECGPMLMEFEHSEVMGFLQHLPPMDMDQILMQAYNIRGEVYARELM